MDGTWSDGRVIVGGTARQQFYDSRGYGEPVSGGGVALRPTEAAYLLSRGDLDLVDGNGFAEFFSDLSERVDNAVARFLTYCDLRERGFYLSPTVSGDFGDFVVYERGSSPHEEVVDFAVRVVGESDSIQVGSVSEGVLAVVDGEAEVSYFQMSEFALGHRDAGGSVACSGVVLNDRVVVWEAPAELHDSYFYGQPFGPDSGAFSVQLSLVEAVYLVDSDQLTLRNASVTDLRDRGRSREGSGFDRRVAVYSALRDHGYTPKTGFKFGADYRVYEAVTSVDDLGHSEYLVQVLHESDDPTARELALEVRLAHGVRKRTIFAVTDGMDVVNWLAVSRLTP